MKARRMETMILDSSVSRKTIKNTVYASAKLGRKGPDERCSKTYREQRRR